MAAPRRCTRRQSCASRREGGRRACAQRAPRGGWDARLGRSRSRRSRGGRRGHPAPSPADRETYHGCACDLPSWPFRPSRIRGPASGAPPSARALSGTIEATPSARARWVRGCGARLQVHGPPGWARAEVHVVAFVCGCANVDACRGLSTSRRWFVLVGSGGGRGGGGICLRLPLRVAHRELPPHLACNIPLTMTQRSVAAAHSPSLCRRQLHSCAVRAWRPIRGSSSFRGLGE